MTVDRAIVIVSVTAIIVLAAYATGHRVAMNECRSVLSERGAVGGT